MHGSVHLTVHWSESGTWLHPIVVKYASLVVHLHPQTHSDTTSTVVWAAHFRQQDITSDSPYALSRVSSIWSSLAKDAPYWTTRVESWERARYSSPIELQIGCADGFAWSFVSANFASTKAVARLYVCYFKSGPEPRLPHLSHEVTGQRLWFYSCYCKSGYLQSFQ